MLLRVLSPASPAILLSRVTLFFLFHNLASGILSIASMAGQTIFFDEKTDCQFPGYGACNRLQFEIKLFGEQNVSDTHKKTAPKGGLASNHLIHHLQIILPGPQLPFFHLC